MDKDQKEMMYFSSACEHYIYIFPTLRTLSNLEIDRTFKDKFKSMSNKECSCLLALPERSVYSQCCQSLEANVGVAGRIQAGGAWGGDCFYVSVGSPGGLIPTFTQGWRSSL